MTTGYRKVIMFFFSCCRRLLFCFLSLVWALFFVSANSTTNPPGSFNPGDIAVVNAMIDNNGLKWTKAIPADGSFIPNDWREITWTWLEDNTNLRIKFFFPGVNWIELTGDL